MTADPGGTEASAREAPDPGADDATIGPITSYASMLSTMVLTTLGKYVAAIQEAERLRNGSPLALTRLEVIARLPAVLAGMTGTDDEELWWLLMDVHACRVDLVDSEIALVRRDRARLLPYERQVHDQHVRAAAKANLARRFRKLVLVKPDLHERMNAVRNVKGRPVVAATIVVERLASVVVQQLYAAKGTSAYDELAAALGALGRAVTRKTLQNKLSLWARQGSLPGLTSDRDS